MNFIRTLLACLLLGISSAQAQQVNNYWFNGTVGTSCPSCWTPVSPATPMPVTAGSGGLTATVNQGTPNAGDVNAWPVLDNNSAALLAAAQGAIPAGANFIGSVASDIVVTPTSNFTRPANTTAYVAGQLVANSTTAGSVVPLSWTATRINAGNGYVRRARMTLSSKSVTNTSFVLHLYTVTPATITNGDGATWLTTLANMFCDINITVTDVGSDVSTGVGVPAAGNECNFVAAAATQTIYGLLSASAAYTPASGETVTVVPEIHQN